MHTPQTHSSASPNSYPRPSPKAYRSLLADHALELGDRGGGGGFGPEELAGPALPLAQHSRKRFSCLR
eukprot:2830449-Rhodomonas_salina.1